MTESRERTRPAPPSSSVDELARAAQGERRAFERLVKSSYAEVWRLCAALVDEQAADDLAQETFVRLTHSLRRFRGQASARTWTLAIARHVCMDELRRRHRQRRRDRRLAAVTAEEPLLVDAAGEMASNELLAHLDSDRRAAFVLTQLFRLSYDEAAAVCGCPTGTIRSRVARARDELIDLIAHDEPTVRRIPAPPA
jgi:RNA polymerase sigma-70 factor, ECF subfamily